MTERQIYDALVIATFVLAIVTFAGASRVVAPYGRHGRKGWGPTVPVRVAWLVMEAPSVFLFVAIFAIGPRARDIVPLVLLGVWLTHYLYRAFLYPLRMRVTADSRTPIAIVAMGFVFNVLNSYLNARSLSAFGPAHEPTWLLGLPFVLGIVLFFLGRTINRWADRVLASLRAPGETGYKIPRGGLYELVSCPNYFGEMLQWIGFALACWSPAGLAFALFTIANLFPRARSHHAWYRETFPDYPTSRRAVIPFVV